MMINILSIRCSLAFAPYLAVSVAEFLSDGITGSRVVRQGGSSLILKLFGTLEEFANTDRVTPFEEVTPIYSLKASESTEGIELRDSDKRIALTAREARKWTGIIGTELDRLNVRQVLRGGIRTVFARIDDGRWILQWGDEVFVPNTALARVLSYPAAILSSATSHPIARRTEEFLLLLGPGTGACVALTDSESGYLYDSD